MHGFFYGLGIISIIIIIFYIVFWFDHRNKPSEFDLVRNHLQRVTHPYLTVKGYGNYHIEYIYNNEHIVEYFKYMSLYVKELEVMKQDTSIKIIKHGLASTREWEKWKI